MNHGITLNAILKGMSKYDIADTVNETKNGVCIFYGAGELVGTEQLNALLSEAAKPNRLSAVIEIDDKDCGVAVVVMVRELERLKSLLS